MTEARFERFFNKRFDMDKLVSENIGEAAFDETQMRMVQEAIKLPSFHSDLQKTFGDYGTINWTRNIDRAKNGFTLTNDHNMEFYKSLMKAAGKEEDFDIYLGQMNDLQGLMIDNNIINPIDYINARNGMDSDIRMFASEALSNLKNGNIDPELRRKIENNPVYIFMGGAGYFKGSTNFEKPSISIKNSLSSAKSKADRLQRVKDQQIYSETSEQTVRKLRDEMIQVKRQCKVV